MEDWVTTHSHSQMVPISGEEADIEELEQRARRIIEQKKSSRMPRKSVKDALRSRQRDDTETEDDSDTPLQTTGVRHLKKVGLVPDSFGKRTNKEEMERHAAKHTGMINPLNIDTDFRFETDSCKLDCNCANTKTKVKSGKFAKFNSAIVRQEVWPHTAVSKKYAKRTTFDAMEFDAFVAGEAKIIYSMMMKGDHNAQGRLRILVLISHWYCKTKNWPVIRSLYESIMEEIELGEHDWTDDFSGYETMLPTATASVGEIVTNAPKVKKYEVYWCKAYQNATCELSAPHMMQIRPEEPAVPVMHICAHCWTNSKKRREHRENECPSKK